MSGGRFLSLRTRLRDRVGSASGRGGGPRALRRRNAAFAMTEMGRRVSSCGRWRRCWCWIRYVCWRR